jgi:hypothetical protein
MRIPLGIFIQVLASTFDPVTGKFLTVLLDYRKSEAN